MAKVKPKKTVSAKTAKMRNQPVRKNPTTFLPVLLATDAARLAWIEDLQTHLADLSSMGLQAKVAHWNIRGPNFIALHTMLDKIAAQLFEHADKVAERIGQMGEIVQGNAADIQKLAMFSPYVESKPYLSGNGRDGWENMVFGLAYGLASLSRNIQVSQEALDHYGDRVTDDLLTEIRRDLDKNAWLLENHSRAIGSI